MPWFLAELIDRARIRPSGKLSGKERIGVRMEKETATIEAATTSTSTTRGVIRRARLSGIVGRYWKYLREEIESGWRGEIHD